MSSYHGWPLPNCLLAWIEDKIALDESWTTGARDLRLPEEVWTVLRGWREELESRDTTTIDEMDRNDFEPGPDEDDLTDAQDGDFEDTDGDEYSDGYDEYDDYDSYEDYYEDYLYDQIDSVPAYHEP
jgi:hypothetical protein